MAKLTDMSRRPWLLPALLGFLVGTLFGLFALGWGLFPVTWVNATPAQLSSSYQEDYLRAAIDSYSHNQDVLTAQLRFQALADKGTDLLTRITNNPQKQSADDISKYSAIAIGKIVTPQSTLTPGPETKTIASKSTLIIILSILCILMVAVGVVLIYIIFIRNRTKRKNLEEEEPAQGYVYEQATPTDVGQTSATDKTTAISEERSTKRTSDVGVEAPPVAQFMTTYTFGDDLYDDTFSIDAPSGEFLGECGAGISDTIGVGDPKKISAFEVWLFDKNDIQTVTKVLMSSHVYNDLSARQRLAIRGEPVLAEAGKTIQLDTATLRLDVRIADMNYGQGSLPPDSYFDRMSLELSIHQK